MWLPQATGTGLITGKDWARDNGASASSSMLMSPPTGQEAFAGILSSPPGTAASRQSLMSRSSVRSVPIVHSGTRTPLPPLPTPGSLSLSTVTQLLRARLQGDASTIRGVLTGGELQVQAAALRARMLDGTKISGSYTGRALCPAPVAQQDYLMHNTAMTRWSGRECVPHGQGAFVYPSGDAYIGVWEAGQRLDGHGEMRWSDGSHYTGEWRNDKRHGRGKFRYANGDVFDGLWNSDRRVDGVGTMMFANGDRYDGEFRENEISGAGTLTYSGESHGAPSLRRHNRGDRFVGRFAHDHRADGQGTMYYADGGVYDGEWMEERRHGTGTMTYGSAAASPSTWLAGGGVAGGRSWRPVEGDSYTGLWDCGKRVDGVGHMVYHDGSTYEGEWRECRRHGRGFLVAADGSTYQGDFVKGIKCGVGRALGHDVNGQPVECHGEWGAHGLRSKGSVTLLSAGAAIRQDPRPKQHLAVQLDYSAGVPQFRQSVIQE